jgi:hypothetical protein
MEGSSGGLLGRLTLRAPHGQRGVRVHVLCDGVSTLGRRPRGDRLKPALDVRIRVEVETKEVVGRRPSVGCDVRDRIGVAGEPLATLKAFVEDAEQPLGLLLVSLDAELVPLGVA